MPYTQKWGISRNAFQSPLSYGDIGKYVPKPKKEVDLKPEVDITEAADNDIIEQNNKISMDEKMNLVDQKLKEDIAKLAKEQEAKEIEEQEYQDSKSGWTKTLDALQDTASVAGLAPAVGAVVDVPNALTSWFRTATNVVGDTAKGIFSGGDFDYRRSKEHFSNALLNTAAILPVVGHAAAATRLGPKVSKTLDTIKTSAKAMKGLKAVDTTSDIAGIYGGVGSAGNLSSSFTDKPDNVFSSIGKNTSGSEIPYGSTSDTTSMYKYKPEKIIKKKKLV